MVVDNLTGKFRVVAWFLWSGTVVAGVVGWFLGKQPVDLAPVIGWVTGALAIGEGANVGKRATYKREHHEISP